MTVISRAELPSSALQASRALDSLELAKTAPEGVDPERALEAARQFEAVFLRQMLKELEEAGALTQDSEPAGRSVYGAMMVSALADQVSAAGGIGLAELVAKALMGQSEPPGTISEP